MKKEIRPYLIENFFGTIKKNSSHKDLTRHDISNFMLFLFVYFSYLMNQRSPCNVVGLLYLRVGQCTPMLAAATIAMPSASFVFQAVTEKISVLKSV
jgi:hypothetical protein